MAAILAGGYLVFYMANSPLQVSGKERGTSSRVQRQRQLRWRQGEAAEEYLVQPCELQCVPAAPWGPSPMFCTLQHAPLAPPPPPAPVSHLATGVIAVVVYGLYGNAYSHFELGSSRHMHELGERASQRSSQRIAGSLCALLLPRMTDPSLCPAAA